MGDMQFDVANVEDKGFFGLMEEKPVASSNPTLQVSVSFGRFENDSLSWEKFSAFSPNKYLEEVGKCATPGSVAQKKAYFEAHYKKIAERKAEIMDQEKLIEKNESFRSVITDQGSIEGENSGIDEGSNVQFTCEEDKHVTDTDAEVNELSIDETVIVKECQSSVDQVKEVEDSPKSEKSEEIAFVEEKPEVVFHEETPKEIAFVEEKSEVVIDVQEKSEEIVFVEEKSEVVIDEQEKPEEVLPVENEVREEILSNETPMKEKTKEKTQKLIKKDGNVGAMNRRRISPKPNQVTKKPETAKIVTSKKTPPSKEIKSTIKATKKPAAPISKATPGFSTPKVYKPASKVTSLTTSSSSLKKETPSVLSRKKQTGPKSLHISMSLGPSASDPTALTSTRKSLIMERMGDKDIVKRAFKSFQKSFDGESTALKQFLIRQNPKKVTSIPSVATGQKENGRPAKVSSIEKRSSTSSRGRLISNVTPEKQQKELSKSVSRPVEKIRLQKNPKEAVNDGKTRRETLNRKPKPTEGSLPV